MQTLLFLVAHGAAAPFALVPLARHFDHFSALTLANVERHTNLITDILIDGLRLTGQRPQSHEPEPRQTSGTAEHIQGGSEQAKTALTNHPAMAPR
jgi:hypothetical protein